MLLPRLTHCSIVVRLLVIAAADEQCCLGLLSCSSLTHVNLGSRCLTPQMWRALPSGLRELQCSLECTPPTSTTFPDLQHVKCQCSLSNCDLELAKLVLFPRLAPELTTLLLLLNDRGVYEDLSRVEIAFCTAAHLAIAIPCSPGSIQDLLYLHERVMAGLAITSAFRGGVVSNGVKIAWKTMRMLRYFRIMVLLVSWRCSQPCLHSHALYSGALSPSPASLQSLGVSQQRSPTSHPWHLNSLTQSQART